MFSPELAVQTLYSSHHGWLISWLLARLGDSADVADLAQEQMGLSLRSEERLVADGLYHCDALRYSA